MYIIICIVYRHLEFELLRSTVLKSYEINDARLFYESLDKIHIHKTKILKNIKKIVKR